MHLQNIEAAARRSSAPFLLILVLSVFFSEGIRGAPSTPSRPNILFILLDDFGFNDLGANSGDTDKTPELNRIAREGVRFTKNYVDSTCSATRAGILTGRYPASMGFRPNGRGIATEIETLPEALSAAGYSTHHIGKWHLGFADKAAWPIQQGFDSFYGFLNQFLLRGPHKEGDYSYKRPTYINPVLQRDNGLGERHKGHLSDLLLAEFDALIKRVAKQDKPWFINYWTYLPHTPLEPADRFADGFADSKEGKHRAMLAQLDDLIGQVLEILDAAELAHNTLVVVVGDNGGTNKQINNNAPFEGAKGMFTEGGLRTPMLMRWPAGLPAGGVIEEAVSYLDYMPTLLKRAGAQRPDTPGRDFWPLIEAETVMGSSLYWQSGNPEYPLWSILDPTGRFRVGRTVEGTLSSEFVDQLYEASSKPSASLSTEGSQALAGDFRRWHQEQRVVRNLVWEGDETGHGSLAGNNYQRALGFKGFTFAISIQPDLSSNRSVEEPQVIAGQEGHWRLALQGERLVADVLGVEVDGMVPRSTGCLDVILAGYFDFAWAFPQSKQATLRLYVNGRRVAENTTKQFGLRHAGYDHPTLIGQAPDGGGRFFGTLERPVIFNEMLVEPEQADAWLDNGIGTLADFGCSAPVSTAS